MVFQRLYEALPSGELSWNGSGLQAAVLVALTDEAEPQVILARRAQHLRLHPGEVAFPGGKREPEDVTPWGTAKREAEEEIGLHPAQVPPIGDLPPLFTRSQYEVFPCVATVPPVFDMVVDPAELESVFMTPLAVFARRESYALEKFTDEQGTRWVPHYQIEGDHIWGVTARVLVQVVNIALGAGLDTEHKES